MEKNLRRKKFSRSGSIGEVYERLDLINTSSGKAIQVFINALENAKTVEERNKIIRSFNNYLKKIRQLTKFRAAELKSMLIRDELTSLYRRNEGKKIAEKIIASSKKFKVIYIDLDDFGSINKEWGHKSGDFVLQKFGEAVNKAIKEFKIRIIPERRGGEEFVIYAPIKTDEAIELVKRIDEHFVELVEPIVNYYNIIERKTKNGEPARHIPSFSVGIARKIDALEEAKKDNANIIDVMINMADGFMREAKKKKGKGRIQYYNREKKEVQTLNARVQNENA